MLLAEKVLMVEPKGFGFNQETSKDNVFQSPATIHAPGEAAMREYQDLKKKLMKAGITVMTFSPKDQTTPDAVFANNWVSTTPDELIIYPMMSENRRHERNQFIIDRLKGLYKNFTDLTSIEKKGLFLEGTGSLVLDHENKTAYACLSGRTHEQAIQEWNKSRDYKLILFHAYDKENQPIYHTNIVMALGDGFSIACLESINDEKERNEVRDALTQRGELLEISRPQMMSFCGNCLALKNDEGQKFLVMSASAYATFTENQKQKLIKFVTIIYSNLQTIETLGGGSARCMLAELF